MYEENGRTVEYKKLIENRSDVPNEYQFGDFFTLDNTEGKYSAKYIYDLIRGSIFYIVNGGGKKATYITKSIITNELGKPETVYNVR